MAGKWLFRDDELFDFVDWFWWVQEYILAGIENPRCFPAWLENGGWAQTEPREKR